MSHLFNQTAALPYLVKLIQQAWQSHYTLTSQCTAGILNKHHPTLEWMVPWEQVDSCWGPKQFSIIWRGFGSESL